MKNKSIFIFLLFCFLISCKDDSVINDEDTPSWKAIVTTGESLNSEKHYHTIGIDISGLASANDIYLSTDAEWLTIMSDRLPSDGKFDVLPEANTDAEERTAKLTLTNRLDGSTYVVELIQNGNIGHNDGSDSKYKVGYGFSCFDEYKSSLSVRKSVIDENKLHYFDSGNTFITLQEGSHSEMYYEFNSAYSLSEMQNNLTNKTSKTLKILGFKKTINRFVKISNYSSSEQYYGYARMVRTVSTKTMDVGALEYIFHNNDIIKSGRLPFSSDFYDIYRKINNANGNEKTKLIKRMIEEYGTHVIVNTSIGGAIDMVATYSHNLVTSLEETTEFVFKTLTGRSSSSTTMSSVTSSFSADGAIKVYGGSESTRKALEDNVKQFISTGTNTLSSSLLDAWLASITRTDKSGNTLDVVDYSFIPIWDLFPDKTTSNKILSTVTTIANESRNLIYDNDVLGFNNYILPLTESIMNFSGTSSLVRVVCNSNGNPIAEICNEYVPSIRSDKRITVVYPIANGKTRISMGLFPGDGENRPAYLSFSGSDVYVNPIEGYGPNNKIDTIYSIQNALYPDNQGICVLSNLSVKDHYLKFDNSSKYYPVVKIGSGYWTRSDIKEYMDWGYTDIYGNFINVDNVVDGYEYALIYYTQSEWFMGPNQKVYDNQTNKNNERDHWYVPRTSDKENLTNYLGRNHKSMLKGQQSGFDAQFLGRCTDIDQETGFELTEMRCIDKDKRCYIVFKDVNGNNVSGASVLVMKPDYTWETLNDEEAQSYYYPVRLFRTNNYNYSTSGI